MKTKALALGLAIIMVLAASCANKAETAAMWPAMESLSAVSMEDISEIDYTIGSVAGVTGGKITDTSQIEDVTLRLKNLVILSETNEGVTDSDLVVTVKTTSKNISFVFEGRILVLEDGARYDIEGMDLLKSYLEGLVATVTDENYNILKDMQITEAGTVKYIKGNGFLLAMPNSNDWDIEQTAPNAFKIFLKAAKESGFEGDLATIIAYNLDDDTYLSLPSYRIAGTGSDKRFVVMYPTDVRWDTNDVDQTALYREYSDYLWGIREDAVNSPFQIVGE